MSGKLVTILWIHELFKVRHRKFRFVYFQTAVFYLSSIMQISFYSLEAKTCRKITCSEVVGFFAECLSIPTVLHEKFAIQVHQKHIPHCLHYLHFTLSDNCKPARDLL